MLTLHPLLADRRSTRAFDPHADVTSQELAVLLEAARWAPSSRNSQPWRFAVGRRGDDTHKRIFESLAPGNRRWAARAPLLLLGAHLTSDGDRPLPHAAYDLGQAVAHLVVQAGALGMIAHQMGGFDADALHRELELPADVRATVVIAIGRRGDPATLPEDLRHRDEAARERHPAASLLLT
jgi:nitroreductase